MSDDDNESATLSTQYSDWEGIFPDQQPNIRKGNRSRDDKDSEDETPPSLIKLLKTKDYTNVSRLAERDHLTDDNWHNWKERMTRILYSCDVAGYITGSIKYPDPTK